MSEHEDKENHRPHLRRANMCDSMEDEIIAGLTHFGSCEPREVWMSNPLNSYPEACCQAFRLLKLATWCVRPQQIIIL